MFCPLCGAEYREGFRECVDCGVALVKEPVEVKAGGRHRDVNLVTIFRSGDAPVVALAKSLLESAGITFVTQGDGVQDLVGWGRFPAGLNLAAGPVVIQVSDEDAEQAQALLERLRESDAAGGDPCDDPGESG